MPAERKPHIGEYVTKTNAIREFRQSPAAAGTGDGGLSKAAFKAFYWP